MRENDLKQLARNVIRRSLRLTPGQRVGIDVVGQAEAMAGAMMEAAYAAGAQPYLQVLPIQHLKSLILHSTEDQIAQWSALSLEWLGRMDAYIGIRSDDNLYEMNHLPEEPYRRYVQGYLQPKQYAMAKLGKWILLKNPTAALAQMAQLSHSDFLEAYAKACNMDYGEWAERTQPLVDLLRQTDRVRIVSPGTDLTFSIGGMDAVICDGKYNLPDGEIFTAPHRDSAHGEIAFNVPTSYMGIQYDRIRLTFREGRAVEVDGPQKQAVQALLGQDEGASRIGEFGIGLNTQLRTPMNNLLFDEKMQGSVHLALGQAYPMADNGNRSAIHWDLVLQQTESFGGGQLYFDRTLVRNNGLFVLPQLMSLNP